MRLAGLDRPAHRSIPLPEETAGIIQPDSDLFWSLKPNLRTEYQGARITTNALGLRGAAIGPKQPGEVRILCLGESTTFGVKVSDDKTYCTRLEELLRGAGGNYRVINAGVSAYSSFQSLVYFEERGLALDPDVVVLYHWVNDTLPTTLRDSGNTDLGLARSDKALHAFRRSLVAGTLLRWSASFRALTYYVGRQRVYWGLAPAPKGLTVEGILLHGRLPPRVPPSERREVLDAFRQQCRERGIGLIVVHPCYRDVDERDEVLLHFCQETATAMVDIPEAFDQSGHAKPDLFLDPMHPTPAGHEIIARAIGRSLTQPAR